MNATLVPPTLVGSWHILGAGLLLVSTRGPGNQVSSTFR